VSQSPAKNAEKDAPNFSAWQIDTLAKYALDQYLQNIELREALEQSRLDLRDAMRLLRDNNTTAPK
jgi:hypothetical protein